MRVDELESMLAGTARRKALKALTGKPGAMVTGLAGSSAAIMLAALPRPKAAPTVVVGENLDDAGYLFFDLCRLVGEGNVAFMPSGFKRDIKYGQADPPTVFSAPRPCAAYLPAKRLLLSHIPKLWPRL